MSAIAKVLWVGKVAPHTNQVVTAPSGIDNVQLAEQPVEMFAITLLLCPFSILLFGDCFLVFGLRFQVLMQSESDHCDSCDRRHHENYDQSKRVHEERKTTEATNVF